MGDYKRGYDACLCLGLDRVIICGYRIRKVSGLLNGVYNPGIYVWGYKVEGSAVGDVWVRGFGD